MRSMRTLRAGFSVASATVSSPLPSAVSPPSAPWGPSACAGTKSPSSSASSSRARPRSCRLRLGLRHGLGLRRAGTGSTATGSSAGTSTGSEETALLDRLRLVGGLLLAAEARSPCSSRPCLRLGDPKARSGGRRPGRGPGSRHARAGCRAAPGRLERESAVSIVITPRRVRSASDCSMVCIPRAVPVCITE